jgi:hypothetical protein
VRTICAKTNRKMRIITMPIILTAQRFT